SLPVELGPFSARQVQNHVVLNWKTYSEIQNLGFEIERTREGGSSEVIKSFLYDPEMQTQGPWGSTYQTIDDQGLMSGRYTYSIYEIDKDGNRTRIATHDVDFSERAIPASLEVSVYPNPAIDAAHISIAVP